MKKRNGLKSKLMIYFMLCIIVPSLIIGYYTYKISYNSFIHKVDKELDRVLNFTMDKMDTKLEQIGMISKMVGQSKHIQEYGDELFVENVDELTYFRVNESIYSMKNRVSEMISDIYILDRYGKIVIGTRPSIISRDMSKNEFFNESINGRDYIGNMIQDTEGEDRTILHSQPLLNSKGQISGVVVLQLKFNVISDIIEESKFGETGFLYLTDRKGLVIQHKDEEKILKENLSKSPKSYKRQIGEEIEAGNRGSVRFDEDGVIKVSMYRSFDNFGIVATMDEKESFDFLYIVRKKIFAIFLLCIILGMIASYFIAERMLRPISDLTDLTQKLGTGDLREKTKINSEDELGSLAEGINHMIDGQRNLIDKIIKASNKVNNMALEASSISQEMASSSEMQKGSLDDLKKVIDEITLSTKDVSNSVIKMAEGLKETSVVMDKIDIMIQEVSESVEETTITVGDVTGSMQEINSSIELIAENSHNASNQAKKTVQIANDGKEKINNTVEEMDKIDVEIKGLTKVIQGLGTSTMQIGDIVELIDDISEQTNLLALNASIEAARAGEHGRGFAVVAEAIGDLAEKAGEATKDISSLIKDVEKEVENAINKTSRGVEQVERGVNLVKGTGNSLDNIFVSIEKTTELINEIAYSTEQQSNASRFIMQMVEKVNSLALQVSMSVEEQVNSVNNVTKEVEKMASLSQEIAGATQQQFASSQEVLENIENVTMIASDTAFASQDVANTAQNLALEADSLMKNVEKFKI